MKTEKRQGYPRQETIQKQAYGVEGQYQLWKKTVAKYKGENDVLGNDHFPSLQKKDFKILHV